MPIPNFPWPKREWGTLKTIADFAKILLDEKFYSAMRQTRQLAAKVMLFGRSIPAAFIDHHSAHAADVYYQSGMSSAGVLSFDGAPGLDLGSMLFVGRGNDLYPVGIPWLNLGWLYNITAREVGLNWDPGKLMGLAPYGQPKFFDPKFIRTTMETSPPQTGGSAAKSWLLHCFAEAHQAGYDMSALGNRPGFLNLSTSISPHRPIYCSKKQRWRLLEV
ncbi:MAG: hypothetical protein EXR10_11940 [Alphaproteobacteria bacterium]|nr:hypothetical protein [Alphaproteobacteria bacterium]